MSFVFPILLGGLGILAVPVLIHLIMRQKPKTLPFPAFRFLLQKHRTNLRKLRLRHLLLLLLRMLLLAGICLALARPKVFSEQMALSADQPVAAVLLFDTSLSMDYKVSDGTPRLEEARRRGRELLEELPEGSRVAILETAEGVPTGPGAWQPSLAQARARVEALRLHAANAPVTGRLEGAFRLLSELALQAENDVDRALPRLVCIFSDRTRACWDPGQVAAVQAAGDYIPPRLDQLYRLRGRAHADVQRLGELRQVIPPAVGQDYPDKEVIDLWQQLADRAGALTPDNYPDRDTAALVARFAGKARLLKTTLEAMADSVPKEAKEYHGGLVASLQAVLDDLRGLHGIFVDVGVDAPVNVGITDLELPGAGTGLQRQVFARNEKFVLRALVQAVGKDVDTSAVCDVGGKSYPRAFKLKAGQKDAVLFEIDCGELAPGAHHVQVRLASLDQLAFDNTRYATFAVREARKVLVVAESADKAMPWGRAIEARRDAGFGAVYLSPARAAELTPRDLAEYQAVYLLAVNDPPGRLWAALGDYVAKGGGVGVIPGGNLMRLPAYASPDALALLPGRYEGIGTAKEPGLGWDWQDDRIYQHPLLRPVRAWRDLGRDDFIKLPRTATRYWRVNPVAKDATVVVRYTGPTKGPALLERRSVGKAGGRVLQFTTRLDAGQKPRWNNYMDTVTSFCVVLPGLATAYLAGETEDPRLNFISGQSPPRLRLPLQARAPAYTVEGPGLLDVIPAGQAMTELVVRQATVPGHYTVRTEDQQPRRVGAFSVNPPPAEGDLTRVPPSEIEAVLGPGAVVAVGRGARLRSALQGHWDQPLELLPFLLLALLLLLALESLLANLFYRREPKGGAGAGGATGPAPPG